MTRLSGASLAAGFLLLAAGCRQDMHDQPKLEPLEPSTFFHDGAASRPLPEGTVARGQLEVEPAGDPQQARSPLPATRELLLRGRERYDIFCSPCHDRVGRGDGMIVRRGFRRPTSFHVDRLQAAPDGHFFRAMTEGFGVMPSYAAAVPPRDRWAIIAYIRALQLSQSATLADVPATERQRLIGGSP